MSVADRNTSVVLLSGGLDSATVLALVRSQGRQAHSVSVRYGQRHGAELDAARRIALTHKVLTHRELHVDLDLIGGSALTDTDISIPVGGVTKEEVPVTYVPARNTLLLSLALGLAEVVDAADLYIGVNAVDYSGYPDCRPEFIEAFQHLANVATRAGVEGRGFRVNAPLIGMSKAEIIRLGLSLNVDYGMTVSCYQADARGYACGRCDACRLRRDGFNAIGVADPTRYV